MTDQEKLELFKKIEEAYGYIAKASEILQELALEITE